MIAEEKEITVRTEITPDIYAQVDESFYIRMVVNLVSNAVFYGREGGIVKISLQVKEENVVGIVEDNGIGISVHDMEHIWERFYRGRHFAHRWKPFWAWTFYGKMDCRSARWQSVC